LILSRNITIQFGKNITSR